jgi:hypothetical protein
MAGPAPKELQQFCTGCSQHLNLAITNGNSPVSFIKTPIPTGANSSLIGNLTLTGGGLGAFSSITGFIIGSMSLISQRSLTGNCTAVTGAIYSGVTGWTGVSTTGCTGTTPCSTNISLVFSGNANIWNNTPTANISVQLLDYLNGTVSFPAILTSGNQNFSGNIINQAQVNCGDSTLTSLLYHVRIPGYSGYITNEVTFETICKPCLLG